MHMRRALLLFAIVLGLAALAAAVSRPLEERRGARGTESAPAPAPAPDADARPPARLSFTAGPPRERRRLEPGRPAVVLVRVDQPGQVELNGLGMNATADSLTPARFDVLASEPVTATVRFTPAGADAAQLVGTLDVSEPGSARSGGRSARRTAPDR